MSVISEAASWLAVEPPTVFLLLTRLLRLGLVLQLGCVRKLAEICGSLWRVPRACLWLVAQSVLFVITFKVS